jgi:hypothetical protein
MIGLGQDSESNDRWERFKKSASKNEILVAELRITLSEIDELKNQLNSLKINPFPSDYFSNEERIRMKQESIIVQDAKKQILEDLIYSKREIISIQRGNVFQSLLRSFIIIFPSVFIDSDFYDYKKFDKFCARFSPSFGLEFTNAFALEQLQEIHHEIKSLYERKIFNDRELNHIFGGMDVSWRDKSRYQLYDWKNGDFSLKKIIIYIRYILCFLVSLIAIRFFRKRQRIKKKSL